jgi:hypothetical protein
MRKQVVVKQDEQNQIKTEVLAQEIVNISRAMQSLNKSKLSRNAVLTLVKDQTNIPKHIINTVIDNLEDLEKNWLK